MSTLLPFIAERFPSWETLVVAGPLSLLWAWGCLHAAGCLRRRGATPCLSLVSVVVGLGLACALVEAASPHGCDNFTMQVVPSLLAFQFI